MIFQHTYQWVIGVSPHTQLPKTQTRRLKNRDEYLYADQVRCWVPSVDNPSTSRAKWVVGYHYAVQPKRGIEGTHRFRIISLREEDVRNISEADVKAEGFKSATDFWRVWCGMHDTQMKIFSRDVNGIWIAPLFPGEHTPVQDPAIDRRTMHIHDEIGLRYELFKRPAERYQAWVIEFELAK